MSKTMGADARTADVANSEGGCAGCTRRQFVNSSLLMAVSGFLAACGDGVIGAGGNSITGPINLNVKLSDYPALGTVGGIARLNNTSTPIAVVRSAAATYLAFSMICPHQGTTIGINGAGFKCPNHGAEFNAAGQWIQSPQPTGNLVRLTTALDTAGTTLTIT